MSFLRRQLVTAALVANAVRPLPGFRPGIAAFGVGGLVSELAPHVLAITAADAATHLTARRRDPWALALAGASAAGLAFLIGQSRRTQQLLEDALVDGLGASYVEQLDALATPAELATPWRHLAYPIMVRNPDVRVEKDIAYGEFGRRNTLDVYRRADGPVEGAPVLLQVHGGGWATGDKEHQGMPLMQHLAARGWVCVAINYRLSPRSAMPDHVIDVKRAIAWIRTHIEAYGGDPGYVAITGGSAGGHLAALAALTPNDPTYQPGFEDVDTRVQAAIPHYGVYDFAGATGLRSARLMRDTFLAPRIVQRSFADDPSAFEALSPLLRITPDAPDFFVLHGTTDSLVDIGQARAFVAALRATSQRSVVYAELPGAQHAFDVLPTIRSGHVVRAIDRYLHWHWNGYREAALGSRV